MSRKLKPVAGALAAVVSIYLVSVSHFPFVLAGLVLALIAAYLLFFHPLRGRPPYRPTIDDDAVDSGDSPARALVDLAERTHHAHSRTTYYRLLASLARPLEFQERLSVQCDLSNSGYNAHFSLDITFADWDTRSESGQAPIALTLGESLPKRGARIYVADDREIGVVTRSEANQLIAQLVREVVHEDKFSQVCSMPPREFLEKVLSAALFRGSWSRTEELLREVNHVFSSDYDSLSLLKDALQTICQRSFVIILVPSESRTTTLRWKTSFDEVMAADSRRPVESFMWVFNETGASIVPGSPIVWRIKNSLTSLNRWTGAGSRNHVIPLGDIEQVRHYSFSLQLPRGFYFAEWTVEPILANPRLQQPDFSTIEVDADQTDQRESSMTFFDLKTPELSVRIGEMLPSSTFIAACSALVVTILLWLIGTAAKPTDAFGTSGPADIDGDILVFLLAFPVAVTTRVSFITHKVAMWTHSVAARLSAIVTVILCATSAALVLFDEPTPLRYLPPSFLGIYPWEWQSIVVASIINALLCASVLLREVASFRSTYARISSHN
ncbi:hypothetical protein [Amycolatopsis keratiniphila]|uniref:hypothetical protein n=1 Tax=Amycolatopsis keratiniphila TaxID=129921 RepID=UPI000ABE446C|nr:hypothetical protein [Amycolatopsis keratiniphila]